MYEIKQIAIESNVIDNKLCLTNYEQLKEIVTLSETSIDTLEVDATNYNDAKKLRASLNNTDKELTKVESNFKTDFMGDFLSKSSDLKKQIKGCSKTLDNKIKCYEKEVGVYTPTMMYLTFKSKDIEILNKINELVEKELNIKGEIK